MTQEDRERAKAQLSAVLERFGQQPISELLAGFRSSHNADNQAFSRQLEEIFAPARRILAMPTGMIESSVLRLGNDLTALIDQMLEVRRGLSVAALQGDEGLARIRSYTHDKLHLLKSNVRDCLSDMLHSVEVVEAVVNLVASDPKQLRGEFELEARDRRAAWSEQTNQFERRAQQVDETLRRAEAVLATASEAAKHHLVTAEAAHFANEVQKHRNAFSVWMASLVLALIALATYVVAIVEPELHGLPTNPTAGEVLKHAIPRVIVFLGGYWLILFLARSAASERHNWIVNQHRVNALRTYKTCIAATTDKRVQDALLVQAANTIFMPQSTGFLKEEPSHVSDSPKVGDVFKVLVGSDKNPTN